MRIVHEPKPDSKLSLGGQEAMFVYGQLLFDTSNECSVIVFTWLCNWVLSALDARKTDWDLLHALVLSMHISVPFSICNAVCWPHVALW